MTPAEMLRLARDAGAVVTVQDEWKGTLRVRSVRSLPTALRGLLREHREVLFRFLMEPAPVPLLEAVARTGRNPSPLLTRGEALELAALPAPPLPSRWELLVDGYHCADAKPHAWHSHPASAAQLALLAKLGVAPPPGATKGECSFAISQLKGPAG